MCCTEAEKAGNTQNIGEFHHCNSASKLEVDVIEGYDLRTMLEKVCLEGSAAPKLFITLSSALQRAQLLSKLPCILRPAVCTEHCRILPKSLIFPPEAVEQAGALETNNLCSNEASEALHECIVALSGGKKRVMVGKLEHAAQSKLGVIEQVITCSTWRQGSGKLGINHRRTEG